MLYSRYYNLDKDQELITSISNFDLFFLGKSHETRAQKVPSLLKTSYKGKVIALNYNIESEKYSLCESCLYNFYKDDNLEIDEKDLLQNFISDLQNFDINGKNVLIDITSIKHPILFYLLKLLKTEFKPNTLLLTYTEPEKYTRKQIENTTKKFDLTEKFCSSKPIPGFLRISDYKKEQLLVALMGFEGNRFSKAFEDINPATRKTYTIVGFPSFQPGWQYYVYSENQNSIEQSKGYSLLNRITANEPFGIYNILEEIGSNNQEFTMNIAPIGTKPHSLGACMYAIDNDNAQLYYDFPSFGDKKRTIGIGKTFLYNLTEFINK